MDFSWQRRNDEFICMKSIKSKMESVECRILPNSVDGEKVKLLQKAKQLEVLQNIIEKKKRYMNIAKRKRIRNM